MSESNTLDRPGTYRVYSERELLIEERRILLQEVAALRASVQAKQAKAEHLRRRIDNNAVER